MKNDHTTCYRGQTSMPNRCSSFKYMDKNVRGTHCATKIQAAGQRNKQRTRHLTIRLWWTRELLEAGCTRIEWTIYIYRLWWTQELVEAGCARTEWIGTKLMIADFLLKALHGVSFKYC